MLENVRVSEMMLGRELVHFNLPGGTGGNEGQKVSYDSEIAATAATGAMVLGASASSTISLAGGTGVAVAAGLSTAALAAAGGIVVLGVAGLALIDPSIAAKLGEIRKTIAWLTSSLGLLAATGAAIAGEPGEAIPKWGETGALAAKGLRILTKAHKIATAHTKPDLLPLGTKVERAVHDWQEWRAQGAVTGTRGAASDGPTVSLRTLREKDPGTPSAEDLKSEDGDALPKFEIWFMDHSERTSSDGDDNHSGSDKTGTGGEPLFEIIFTF